MKNIIIILIGFISLVLVSSCEEMMGDYLEKAPGVDVTEDTIFSSQVQVETFIAATYRLGIHPILPKNENTHTPGPRYDPSAVTTDEAEAQQTWTEHQFWNVADITDENISFREDRRFPWRFRAIRMANVLMTRIDDVPDVTDSYKNWVKGEARFIRALNYFEMFKRYGGVPILDKKLEINDDFMIPRNTVQEVVDFIVADCDQAIALLPDVYMLDNKDMRGRATKGAALALKAKTLLYAASPIFNTDSPYMSMADESQNNLISYGNYDANRWQKAADAAKAVIDWAPSGNVALVTNQGVDNNYRYIFEKADNSEVILANKMFGARAIWEWPWTGLLPQNFYSSTWGMGNGMTVNFLKKYEKQDGTPQTWETNGNDLLQKFNELDRRFKQSVGFPGARWNNDIAGINTHQGGNHVSRTGMWITKFIPPSLSNSANRAMPNDITFRLGEFYLNFAEASNEAQGPTQAAYDAVNTIRARSGQPPLPSGLSKDEFRVRVRNERAVELFYEDHRLWDLRRWLVADQDGVMKGAFQGFKIYKTETPNVYTYDTYTFETRSFNPRMYLHPFPRAEVLKGYLVQNPGY